jgi:hypothetical protein
MPNLKLPQSQESLFYRGMVARLQADPTLKRVVKKWFVFGDECQVVQPNTASFPMIALAPTAEHAEPITEGSTESPMSIDIVVYINGLDVDDLLNLWGAIRSAIWTGDGSLKTLMNDSNCTGVFLSKPAYQAAYPKTGDNYLVGEGSVIGRLRVPTRI